MTHQGFKLLAIATIALAIVGCGGGTSTVRPYVKRGGAEISADPTPAQTKVESKPTDGKTKS